MDIGGGGRGRYYVHRTDALTSVAFCVALILLPLILIAAGRASARPVRPSLIYNEATVSSQMVGWGDVIKIHMKSQVMTSKPSEYDA